MLLVVFENIEKCLDVFSDGSGANMVFLFADRPKDRNILFRFAPQAIYISSRYDKKYEFPCNYGPSK